VGYFAMNDRKAMPENYPLFYKDMLSGALLILEWVNLLTTVAHS